MKLSGISKFMYKMKSLLIVVLLVMFCIEIFLQVITRVTNIENRIDRYESVDAISTTDLDVSQMSFGQNIKTRFKNELGIENTIFSSLKYNRVSRLGEEVDSSHKNIFIIGDSFIHGYYSKFENTVPVLLDRYIANNFPNKSFKSWNLGVPGSGTINQFSYLVQFFLDTPVHEIILCFSLGNDLRDNLVQFGSKDLVRLHNFLAEESNVLVASEQIHSKHTFFKSWKITKFIIKKIFLKNKYTIVCDKSDEELPIKIDTKEKVDLINTSTFWGELRSYSKSIDRYRYKIALINTKKALIGIKKYAALKRAKLRIVLIPSKAAVYEEFLLIPMLKSDSINELDQAIPKVIEAGYDFNQPANELIKICNDLHLRYLDLTPIFKAKRQDKLFFNWGSHWSNYGQQLVAEEIWNNILAKDLK